MHSFDVEITTIVSIKHSRCNIRYILPRVTLSRDIYFVSVHRKGVNEVLLEARELCSHVVLVIYSDVSRRKPCADKLINVNHVSGVSPAVRIHNWGVSS